MAKKGSYLREYGGMIIHVDEVLAHIHESPRRKLMRTVLRESGVRGRLNNSQLDGLWMDSSGGITVGMHLGYDFWERFEERASQLIDPINDIEVKDGTAGFVQKCNYSQSAYVFNSPKSLHNVLLEKLGVPADELAFFGGTHCSEGNSFGATKSLSLLVRHALEDLGVHPSFAVYIGAVDDAKTGYRCAQGNNVDYFGVDFNHTRGSKTRFTIGTITASLKELSERVSFFDREEYLRRLDELEESCKERIQLAEDLLEEVEELDPKKPSRKNKKNRNRH